MNIEYVDDFFLLDQEVFENSREYPDKDFQPLDKGELENYSKIDLVDHFRDTRQPMKIGFNRILKYEI